MIEIRTVESPVGSLTLAVRGGRLCLLHFGSAVANVRATLERWYPDDTMGEGASVESAVIGSGARLGERTHVAGSIVGERAVVGADCEVRGLSVVGPSAEVGDRNMLDHGVRIASGERIAAGALHFS